MSSPPSTETVRSAASTTFSCPASATTTTVPCSASKSSRVSSGSSEERTSIEATGRGLAAARLTDAGGGRREAAAENAGQVLEDLRPARDQGCDVLAGELERGCRDRSDDGRGARLAADERHLADHVPAAEPCDVAVVEHHACEPLDDHEEAVPGLAFPADDVARSERLRPHRLLELPELGGTEPREEG